jgi:hypothetical protein
MGVASIIAPFRRLFALFIMLIGFERISGFSFDRGTPSNFQVDPGSMA